MKVKDLIKQEFDSPEFDLEVSTSAGTMPLKTVKLNIHRNEI
jgi:hypothetical protein